MPPERQTSSWVRRNIRCFPTRAPIAIDDVAPVVEFFEVDETRGDGAGGEGGGGKADGFGLVDVGALGVREPGVELGEG